MADELTTGETPATGGEMPQTPATPAAPAGQAPFEEPFDAERARRTIDQLRQYERDGKEAKRLQRELEQAQARLKAIDEEKLSETERLTRQKAELEAELASERARGRDLAIRAAIEREAHKQGAVDVEIVLAVVDRKAIEVDEDGQVKGAGKAVKDLLEAKPLLRDGAPYSGAIPNTPRPSGQTLTRDQQIEQAQKELQQSGRYRV